MLEKLIRIKNYMARYDEKYLERKNYIVIQINGKKRGLISKKIYEEELLINKKEN